LHGALGCRFERGSWRPIMDRLGGRVRSIAVDLPGQRESAGPPCALEALAAQVHRLVEDLGSEPPVVVGHSMSGAVAMIYAATYPTRAAVDVDLSFDVRPFGELVQRLEPMLRGAPFEHAFAPFQDSMGFDRVPEPLRSHALAAQHIRRDVVLGYWDELLRTDPDELQAWIENITATIDVPILAVFGDRLSQPERDYTRRLVPGAQIEEWPGSGHLVHLAEADRFAARLLEFVAGA